MTAPIFMVVSGDDDRIRPGGPDYKGPPGPIYKALPIEKDERGEFQLIFLVFRRQFLRVPPLHTWPEGGYVRYPDRETDRTPSTLLEATPESDLRRQVLVQAHRLPTRFEREEPMS